MILHELKALRAPHTTTSEPLETIPRDELTVTELLTVLKALKEEVTRIREKIGA